MKWFQHYTDSYTNLKHREIIEEFGVEGYGFFWICCELVGQQGVKYRLKNPKSWLKALKNTSTLPEEKIKKLLQKFASLNLINSNALKNNELYIPKMKNYSDDYTKKVRRMSGQCPVRIDKITLDKITLHYIKEKGWEEQAKNPKILNSIFKRNVKPAKDLALLAEDVDYAIKALSWVSACCRNKGLSWTLETVISWYPEYLKKYPPEDKTPKVVKDLVKEIINKEAK